MSAVERIIESRPRSIGPIMVQRVLPSLGKRLVGPFVFFDHLPATTFAPGQATDVLPHPHIGLATVTYLFEGELVHRDSLGSEQTIRPGAINWMTAGRGIAHSERTPPEAQARGFTQHGLQLWVALPAEHEEDAPAFHHHPAESLPRVALAGGVEARVLVGRAYGASSPVATLSPLFYVDARLPAGGRLPLPDPAEQLERAAYIVEGAVRIDGGEPIGEQRMIVFTPGATAELGADGPARVMLLGGEPLEGPRHIWWNFVSSSRERIEQAKRDWKEGRFAKIPGDEVEFVPLPEG